jgi:hypothetical protein
VLLFNAFWVMAALAVVGKSVAPDTDWPVAEQQFMDRAKPLVPLT